MVDDGSSGDGGRSSVFQRWIKTGVTRNTAHDVARDIMTREVVACSHARVGVAAESVEHSFTAGAKTVVWVLSHVKPGFDARNELSGPHA